MLDSLDVRKEERPDSQCALISKELSPGFATVLQLCNNPPTNECYLIGHYTPLYCLFCIAMSMIKCV